MSEIRASNLPNPFAEIRIVSLSSLRGANYWSRRPVARMDVAIGAFEDHSSADAPWMTEQLVGALPGIYEHRCSIGRPGGFLERIAEGTYAAHITEHVALELQSMIGHEAGFGRTRGTGELGEYTIVVEHHHELVGTRALALALGVVQRGFAGILSGVDAEIAELKALGTTPDTPPIRNRVLCGITGGGPRAETAAALTKLGFGSSDEGAEASSLVVDIAPGYLFQAGLPYSRSEIAIILDAAPTDVPTRFTDAERAARLVGIVADGVGRGGTVVCAANAGLVHDVIRDAGRVVRKFTPSDEPSETAARAARVAADFLGASTQRAH